MDVKREFNLGDEWIYLKLYSGPKILENILVKELSNLIGELFDAKIIDKFFFIRYVDEDYHLRVRFHLVKKSDGIGLIISKINDILLPYSNNSIVWKINYDTYYRELERYGTKSIADVETLFFVDSLIVLKALNIMNLEVEEFQEDTRWMYSIKIIMFFLKSFDIDIDTAIKILDQYSEAMIAEFDLNKYDKNVLNDLYRENQIITLIDPVLDHFFEQKEFVVAVSNILKLVEEDKLEVQFVSLIQSLIHMTNNRIFRTNQRQNETYVYYFMSKGLKSVKAKSKLNYEKLSG
jgi:thiopeptide-type bacteriocin biosynthesis protein